MRKWLPLLVVLGFSAPLHADMNAAQHALEDKDYATARKLLEAESVRNNTEARYQLGIMYRDGLGVKRDPAKALEWFEEAGKSDWMRERGKFGYPEAQYQAGLMYRDGIGTGRDPEEAADWFEDAAEQGHGPAQFALARMLLKGDGIDRDYEEAFIWASLAADSLAGDEAQQAGAIRDEAARHLTAGQLADARQEIEERAEQ